MSHYYNTTISIISQLLERKIAKSIEKARILSYNLSGGGIMRGVNFSAYHKKQALKMWLVEKEPVYKVTSKFKCTERSLWRWKAIYDGTLESLQPKTSRKEMLHPNRHTEEEREMIIQYFKKHPHVSFNEAFGELRAKIAYKRSYGGFYNFVRKNNIRPHKQYEKYAPQPYDTPEMLGVKWQMDVKYVPKECFAGEVLYGHENRYYQYTMIDEATRERFIFPYREFGARTTVNFVKRAIAYFGYAPSIIQTDNGAEFTNVRKHGEKEPKKHALDILLENLKIKHQLIRAYTPRLNGKVERSHRSDQESFYNYLKFKNYDELKKKMLKWNIAYNKRPHASLKNREGKQVWWSPLEKRADLLKLLEEKKEEYAVRFVKTPLTIRQAYAA